MISASPLPKDIPPNKDNLMQLIEEFILDSEKANTPNPFPNTDFLQIATFNTPLTKNLLHQSNQIKNPPNPPPTSPSNEPVNLVNSSSLSEGTSLTRKPPLFNSEDHLDIPFDTLAPDSTSSSPVNHHYLRSPDRQI